MDNSITVINKGTSPFLTSKGRFEAGAVLSLPEDEAKRLMETYPSKIFNADSFMGVATTALTAEIADLKKEIETLKATIIQKDLDIDALHLELDSEPLEEEANEG